MPLRFDKVHLVFPRHTAGNLARDHELQAQPPLGLLTLAAYLRRVHPDVDIEVFDGKVLDESRLVAQLDAPLVGISTWFSNFERAKWLAAQVKRRVPGSTVIMGGPHATPQAERILQCDPNVDYVVRGEGEIAFSQFVQGLRMERIQGLAYRGPNGSVVQGNATAVVPELGSVPAPALDLLRPKYTWQSSPAGPAMSAFPVSGLRGCTRRPRCEYCAIPTASARTMPPEQYWQQIQKLQDDYGIDYFFETGDIFTPKYLRQVSACPNRADVSFRIYAYPGLLGEAHLPDLVRMGVRTIFIGVESQLVWERRFRRKYARSYSQRTLVDELRAYGAAGTAVIPAFLLGLPGESRDSLRRNVELIEEVADLSNVQELTLSIVLPLPGSEYFEMCIRDLNVRRDYQAVTGHCLETIDAVDVYVLSELFVRHFCQVEYDELQEIVDGMRLRLGDGLANWGASVKDNGRGSHARALPGSNAREG